MPLQVSLHVSEQAHSHVPEQEPVQPVQAPWHPPVQILSQSAANALDPGIESVIPKRPMVGMTTLAAVIKNSRRPFLSSSFETEFVSDFL